MCWNYGTNIFHPAVTYFNFISVNILCNLWFLGKCFDRSCQKILPTLVFTLLEKAGLNQMIFCFPFCLLSLALLLFSTKCKSLLKPLSFNASWYSFKDLPNTSLLDHISESLFPTDFNCFRILGGWLELLLI